MTNETSIDELIAEARTFAKDIRARFTLLTTPTMAGILEEMATALEHSRKEAGLIKQEEV